MRFSKIISILLHPIFMPTIAVYLSVKLIPEVEINIKKSLSGIYLVLFFSTIILPLISILVLIKRKAVSSLEMKNYKERPLPLFISFIWMSIGYYTLEEILTPVLRVEILCAIIITFVASIISKYWKISIHMLGLGGVIGIVIGLNILFGGLIPQIMGSIVCAGALSWARIREKAHNYTQVYVGFLVGFLIQISGLLLFYNYIYNFNLSL